MSELRRYTDLPALLYALHERQITLLDPKGWDDANDSYFLELYAELTNCKTILALCFTQTFETYHHWKVFAHGPSGVCVIFDRTRLLNAVARAQPDVKAREVSYKTLKDIKTATPAIEHLPFMKRWAFQHEKEFRLVYAKQRARKHALNIPIPVNAIARVVLSPWMHPTIAPQVIRTIKAIRGFRALQIDHSSLIDNAAWKD